jgi:hypothetical protein
VLYAAGTAENAVQRAAVTGHLERIRAAVAPWAADRVLLNFAEGPADPSTAFSPPAFRRLRDVRSRVDPDGVFAAGHAIPTA